MNYNDFVHPDKEFFPRPLWFWNERPTKARMDEIMDSAERESAYGGFGILSYKATELPYMEDEYLDAYEYALKKAKENGLKLCLYDEWWFPSGSAGGILKQRYPESCARMLVKTECDPTEPAAIPEGTLMAAVAMNMKTKQIVNLRGYIQNGVLNWTTEEENWKILIFNCVLSDWEVVNYLDPEAVMKFIEVTHEVYYARFAEYFGNVIDSSFYDEPQMYAVGGKMWTDDFNDRFVRAYGVSPEELYPALWYDIGENTAAARCMFHELRAQMYAEGFPKVVQEWCTAHGIALTGHVDQEEMINPTGITGDLMKTCKYQDIPGFDEIMTPGRGSRIYKIISSAANNWDKPLVMSECYGAMAEDISIETLYDEAMEQYAKGMNLFVPHAVWSDPAKDKIIFHPELSFRNERYQGKLKPLNEFCARMSQLLQGGRHIADIAVLYPIRGLNASYYFEWGDPYLGGPAPEYYDYQQIGEWLSSAVRKDFTFLHPEVLEKKCVIENGRLLMPNQVNYERFQVLILPGTDTIGVDSLKMAKDFYEQGGTVIATSMLPVHADRPGKDGEVKAIISAMFGEAGGRETCLGECSEEKTCIRNTNEAGGNAWFLPKPSAELLEKVLDTSGIYFDVCLDVKNEQKGLVTYLHKERDGKDLYYFINCGDENVMAEVSLHSMSDLEIWDPHSGTKNALDGVPKTESGRVEFALSIEAHRSVVLISKEA